MDEQLRAAAELARRHGISAAAIARRAGISDRTVRNAFQGKRATLPLHGRAIAAAVASLLPSPVTVNDGQRS